jgi:uncharacterized protein
LKTIEYKIPAGNEILSCSVDYVDDTTPPTVICLHGGGLSNKNSTKYLSPAFFKHRKSVIRFDFSGQGDSSGDLKESSLKKRYIETKTVLDYLNVTDNLTVVGSSMGGYIAGKLILDYTIDNLILFCPAAYSIDAWDIGFSNGFTKIIRIKNSYLNTDIFKILKTFVGKSLFIIGSEDEVIPEIITELYLDSLENSVKFEKLIIKNCPHPIHRWGERNPEIQEKIKVKIDNLLL